MKGVLTKVVSQMSYLGPRSEHKGVIQRFHGITSSETLHRRQEVASLQFASRLESSSSEFVNDYSKPTT